jgi:hypothetical protein
MINLADIMKLGPFEFSKQQLQHQIAEAQWKELLEKAEDYQVDATNVNRTIQLPLPLPLPQHKAATKAKKQKI